MSDENSNDVSGMSIDDVDQMLFNEPAPSAPEPNVAELLQQAGLQRQSPQPQEAAPQPETEAQAEPAPAEASDPMQQFMSQQAQTSQQMLELQQQLAQQQPQQNHEPQFNIDDSRQVSDYMEQIGLDPTDAAHVYMFRSDYERRQNESAYHQQLQGMNEYITYMQNQQYQQQAEQTVAPQIDATLKPYGNIPAETIDNIKAQAATLMSHGQYDQAQAIQAAVEPYLPLLRALQGQPAAPQQQQSVQAQPSAQNAQAVLAAALTGRSTGHGPTVADISLEDLEGKLFS